MQMAVAAEGRLVPERHVSWTRLRITFVISRLPSAIAGERGRSVSALRTGVLQDREARSAK